MLSVRFAFALDCRRSFGGAGVQRLLGSGERRLDIRANPMRYSFRCNCAGGPSERVGQLLQPNQLISRRFEACQSLFG